MFAPIFAGKGSLFILIFTIVLSLILTNLGSNIAFGAAMIPIIAPFVIESGMNPQFAGAAMIYVINIGMILPGASAPASIFHSQPILSNGGMQPEGHHLRCRVRADRDHPPVQLLQRHFRLSANVLINLSPP